MQDKVNTVQEKIVIERLILDIENNITNNRIKTAYSFETTIELINKNHKKDGVFDYNRFRHCSKKSSRKNIKNTR